MITATKGHPVESEWHIECGPKGTGRITHEAHPRVTAQWAGDTPLPCPKDKRPWTDRATDEDNMQLFDFKWADIGDLKQFDRDLKSEMISVRKQLHTMQGDFLRQEQAIATVQNDVDRIKSRLNLVEA